MNISGIFVISYILFAAEAFLLKTKRVKADNVRLHLFLIEAAFSIGVLCAFLAKDDLAGLWQYAFPLIIYVPAFLALYLFMFLSYIKEGNATGRLTVRKAIFLAALSVVFFCGEKLFGEAGKSQFLIATTAFLSFSYYILEFAKKKFYPSECKPAGKFFVSALIFHIFISVLFVSILCLS